MCSEVDVEPVQSFESWYEANYRSVAAALAVAVGGADEGREAADEAFARAWERWSHVGAMSSPAGWVYRVGVNYARRRRVRRGLEQRILRRTGTRAEVAGPEPGHQEVLDAMRTLPPRQRSALALRYVLDLPQHDVARMLGVADGTASATLTAARRRLQAALDRPTEAPT
jgi:RNA polymerase sigma-70 factor (ECF subfamily)